MDKFFSHYPATFVLLIVTSSVSLIAMASREFWRFLALEPYRMFAEKEFHGVITSGFVHSGFGHLAINMYVLYMFGRYLEVVLDSPQFVIVYVAGLVIGSLYPLVKYRNQPDYIAIGASGAVSGVVFGYCLFFPFETLYLMFAIPMPSILFAVLYVGYSVYAMKKINDNIGHEAHLAGAAGGLLATMIIEPQSLSIFVTEFQALFS